MCVLHRWGGGGGMGNKVSLLVPDHAYRWVAGVRQGGGRNMDVEQRFYMNCMMKAVRGAHADSLIRYTYVHIC